MMAQRRQLAPPEAAEYSKQDEGAIAFTHGFGQGVDLAHGQHMSLRRAVLPRSPDPARVSADEAVVYGSVHNGAEQPVGFAAEAALVPESMSFLRHRRTCASRISATGREPSMGSRCRFSR